MADILRFPHPTTPRELAEFLLENIDNIDSLIVIVSNKKHFITCNWAELPTGEGQLPAMYLWFQKTLLEAMHLEDEKPKTAGEDEEPS